jgi:hypothetical protein
MLAVERVDEADLRLASQTKCGSAEAQDFVYSNCEKNPNLVAAFVPRIRLPEVSLRKLLDVVDCAFGRNAEDQPAKLDVAVELAAIRDCDRDARVAL